MDAAGATFEHDLDSSKHIIAQFVCPMQCFLMHGFRLFTSLVLRFGF
jgi:hypothetical protein